MINDKSFSIVEENCCHETWTVQKGYTIRQLWF